MIANASMFANASTFANTSMFANASTFVNALYNVNQQILETKVLKNKSVFRIRLLAKVKNGI